MSANASPKNTWFSFLRGEPHLGPLEDAYRDSTRKDDINQIAVIAYIYVVGLIAYAFLDYQLLGFSPELWVLYAGRALLAVMSLGAPFVLNRTKSAQRGDLYILVWTTAAAVLAVYVHFTRPESLLPNALGDLIDVIVFYTVAPNRFHFRIIPALLLSLGDIAVLLFLPTGISKVDGRAIITTLVLGNLAGMVISVNLYTYRRNQFKAQHEERRAREQVERLATIDSLTNLFNRRRFMELADAEFQRFRRYGHTYSLVLFDLDHFKHINDTYGHLAGDAVLKEFSALLHANLRTNDSAGRLGGEEFALLFPETGAEEALVVANRIREKCEALTVTVPGAAIRLTTSIGLALVQSIDSTNDDVYRRSDEALYAAKRNGRNRVECSASPASP